jgi:hypothetical protein
MSHVPQFLNLVGRKGSTVLYHRHDSAVPCPCMTPEGYRDPLWHLENPTSAICNAAGYLTDGLTHVIVKAFVQPIQSTRATRLSGEYITTMFGEIQADDHLGIFPVEWAGTRLNFRDWSTAGEDYIEYNGERFTVVNSNMIPDPADGNPEHHWELGLRVINEELVL